MDLVVTIPKHEIDNFEQELQEMEVFNLSKMYKVMHIPQMLAFGDDVYFLLDGEVKYKGRYIQIINSPFSCETTNREWDGIFLEITNIKELSPVGRIKMTGFQGYRYRWWGF